MAIAGSLVLRGWQGLFFDDAENQPSSSAVNWWIKLVCRGNDPDVTGVVLERL